MTHFAVLVLTDQEGDEGETQVYEFIKHYDEQKEITPKKRYVSQQDMLQALLHYIAKSDESGPIENSDRPSMERLLPLGSGPRHLDLLRHADNTLSEEQLATLWGGRNNSFPDTLRAMEFLTSKWNEWCGRDAGWDEEGLYEILKYNQDGYFDYGGPDNRWWSSEFDSKQGIKLSEVNWEAEEEDYVPKHIITPDGLWHKAERVGWFGMRQSTEDHFIWKKRWEIIKMRYANCYAWRCDCHV